MSIRLNHYISIGPQRRQVCRVILSGKHIFNSGTSVDADMCHICGTILLLVAANSWRWAHCCFYSVNEWVSQSVGVPVILLPRLLPPHRRRQLRSAPYICSFGSLAFLFTFVTLLFDSTFCTLSKHNLCVVLLDGDAAAIRCCSLIRLFMAVSLIE